MWRLLEIAGCPLPISGITTPMEMLQVFFEKSTTNVAQIRQSLRVFPETYAGLAGYELLTNAPKTP